MSPACTPECPVHVLIALCVPLCPVPVPSLPCMPSVPCLDSAWTLFLPSISAPAAGAVRQELGLALAPCSLEQLRASISHTRSAWQDPALGALKCVVATVASLGEVYLLH